MLVVVAVVVVDVIVVKVVKDYKIRFLNVIKKYYKQHQSSQLYKYLYHVSYLMILIVVSTTQFIFNRRLYK